MMRVEERQHQHRTAWRQRDGEHEVAAAAKAAAEEEEAEEKEEEAAVAGEK